MFDPLNDRQKSMTLTAGGGGNSLLHRPQTEKKHEDFAFDVRIYSASSKSKFSARFWFLFFNFGSRTSCSVLARVQRFDIAKIVCL